LAKSILGGRGDKALQDNGVPGPDAYQQNIIRTIPGFVIKEDTKKHVNKDEKPKKVVGP